MSANITTMDTVARLQYLADAGTGENRLVSIMVGTTWDAQQDVPTAIETYGLLSHFLHYLPVRHTALSREATPVELAPVIHFDAGNGRLLALVPIGTGELYAVAYWCTINMTNTAFRQMPGLLALPFSLETHAGTEVLIPDWCRVFFADGKPSYCIPILTLRARFSLAEANSDWLNAALARLRTYALPVEAAMQFILPTTEARTEERMRVC
jgi:hypothetical protein